MTEIKIKLASVNDVKNFVSAVIFCSRFLLKTAALIFRQTSLHRLNIFGTILSTVPQKSEYPNIKRFFQEKSATQVKNFRNKIFEKPHCIAVFQNYYSVGGGEG